MKHLAAQDHEPEVVLMDRANWPDIFPEWCAKGWRSIFGFCYARCKNATQAQHATQDGALEISRRKETLDFPVYPLFQSYWYLCSRTVLKKAKTQDDRNCLLGDLVEKVPTGRGLQPTDSEVVDELLEREYRSDESTELLKQRLDHVLSLLSEKDRIAFLIWVEVDHDFVVLRQVLGVVYNTATKRVADAIRDLKRHWRELYNEETPLPTW